LFGYIIIMISIEPIAVKQLSQNYEVVNVRSSFGPIALCIRTRADYLQHQVRHLGVASVEDNRAEQRDRRPRRTSFPAMRLLCLAIDARFTIMAQIAREHEASREHKRRVAPQTQEAIKESGNRYALDEPKTG
jgi:hypothetical protein